MERLTKRYIGLKVKDLKILKSHYEKQKRAGKPLSVSEKNSYNAIMEVLQIHRNLTVIARRNEELLPSVIKANKTAYHRIKAIEKA